MKTDHLHRILSGLCFSIRLRKKISIPIIIGPAKETPTKKSLISGPNSAKEIQVTADF